MATEVQGYTVRIREALALLPKDIRSGDADNIRDDLQEIMGAAATIADLLGIDL